jgi:hypothetical protein
VALLACLAPLHTWAQSRPNPDNCCGTGPRHHWRTTHTPTEAWQGHVVVGLRPEWLPLATPTSLGIPELEETLRSLGVVGVRQRFPNAMPPREGFPNDVEIRTQFELIYQSPLPVEELVARLERLTHYFAFAEPMYIQQPLVALVPNDLDSAASWFAPLIKAPDAWGEQLGNPGVVIAIIDVGTYYTHEDLITNVFRNTLDPINGVDDDGDGYTDNYYGWDFCGDSLTGGQTPNPDANPQPNSLALDHGTFVASLSSATPNNDTGVVGSGYLCRFMPLKTACEADGQLIYYGYEAIVYAADHGAKVINCSWGGFSGSQSQLDIINYATFNRDALVVAAGGNDPAQGALIPFPARYDNVLAVTGSTNTDLLGQNTRGCRIDVAAPGNSRLCHPNGGYFSFAGTYTSFAAPIASGVAGLVRSQFPNLSAQQVRHRLRATSDNIYVVPGNSAFVREYGKGRINAYNALTLSTPSVVAESITFTDGNDNLAQTGDTLRLVAVVRNFLAPTANLQVQVVSEEPAVLAVISPATVSYAQIPTLGVRNNNLNPFRLVVQPNAPINYTVKLRLQYTDGLYTEYQCFTITVNPTSVDVNNPTVHTLATTVSGTGHLGSNGFGSNQGQGAAYLGRNYLTEGGFMLGKTAQRLADNLRNENAVPSTDFALFGPISNTENGFYADQEVVAQFTDANLGLPHNVRVRQETYAWRTVPDDQFVLFRYIIRNNAFLNLDSLYVGWMMDWDLENYANDNAAFDSTYQLAYAWGDDSYPSRHIGLAVLTQGRTLHSLAQPVAAAAFTDSAKFAGISSGTAAATLAGADVVQTLGVGPFNIGPNQNDTLIVALVAGNSLADLRQQVLAARQKYICTFVEQPLNVVVTAPTVACGQATLSAATAGASGYLWNNNQATPSITVTASGVYSVQVFSDNGCAYTGQATVTVRPPLVPNANVTPLTVGLTQGGTISCTDNTPNATTWSWDFGDGFGFAGRNFQYAYQTPGVYTVSLVVSDGVCTDTLQWTVTVVPTGSAEATGEAPWRVLPNPATDALWVETPAGESPAPALLTVLDATGRAVLHQALPATQRQRIEVGHLPRGLYHIRLQRANALWATRLVLE